MVDKIGSVVHPHKVGGTTGHRRRTNLVRYPDGEVEELGCRYHLQSGH